MSCPTCFLPSHTTLQRRIRLKRLTLTMTILVRQGSFASACPELEVLASETQKTLQGSCNLQNLSGRRSTWRCLSMRPHVTRRIMIRGVDEHFLEQVRQRHRPLQCSTLQFWQHVIIFLMDTAWPLIHLISNSGPPAYRSGRDATMLDYSHGSTLSRNVV
ncbi:hypothetical protein, variant [Exophiala dermatitidis NIH/UT8656]|uniref:Uncharacterized protein n=1 Tax=Exophiala dermatitidis (strain ATCC 34100 / CBS 525.76 / NIH/UT8656) TaxID=858893 RepID=H6BYW6_EXODN|nr:uncharacterized protein HMPREF1120_04895 [Exophiala dermatitidis NIH/UT8656]XP_009157292.1 hypothetical protein, variant [Exophiala dermatitidis NIH/UT8656]EHY56830.1 hypothetical protein, variant [Exophiala dermatitidis NIH/UT8656]EHY56831.1 hypothetical protein HMPREF1120_04895 [Exophiala dermatitidis NIH/UT8656]